VTPAEENLLAKARRGDVLTVEDKLSVIATRGDVEWFAIGLRDQGLETPETRAACARRKAELEGRL
jgi:hypothetical protein